MEEILAATKQPMKLHKDIAQEHQIPANLVSRLARQAEQQDDMLEKHKRRKLADERNREAIEEITTDMLARNAPIMRIQ